MDRFHIVVSNYNRIESFVRNFSRIKNFNLGTDKIYIMDCSPEETWESQFEHVKTLTKYGLEYNNNLFFIRRRNWNMNFGAQLDYIKDIIDNVISEPKYTAFVQEHYFDLVECVKDDTIPENANYDLDTIEAKFVEDQKVGCIFFARNGIRVSLTNPLKSRINYFWGDEQTIDDEQNNSKYRALLVKGQSIKGAKPRCFFVDGGNFLVKISYYLGWFKTRKHLLVEGDGSYGFCQAWEVRVGDILYKQNIKWVDMLNNISYDSIDELHAIETKSFKKLSKQWYDNRTWFFYYGRDMTGYMPFPLSYIRKYLSEYIRNFNAIKKSVQ